MQAKNRQNNTPEIYVVETAFSDNSNYGALPGIGQEFLDLHSFVNERKQDYLELANQFDKKIQELRVLYSRKQHMNSLAVNLEMANTVRNYLASCENLNEDQFNTLIQNATKYTNEVFNRHGIQFNNLANFAESASSFNVQQRAISLVKNIDLVTNQFNQLKQKLTKNATDRILAGIADSLLQIQDTLTSFKLCKAELQPLAEEVFSRMLKVSIDGYEKVERIKKLHEQYEKLQTSSKTSQRQLVKKAMEINQAKKSVDCARQEFDRNFNKYTGYFNNCANTLSLVMCFAGNEEMGAKITQTASSLTTLARVGAGWLGFGTMAATGLTFGSVLVAGGAIYALYKLWFAEQKPPAFIVELREVEKRMCQRLAALAEGIDMRFNHLEELLVDIYKNLAIDIKKLDRKINDIDKTLNLFRKEVQDAFYILYKKSYMKARIDGLIYERDFGVSPSKQKLQGFYLTFRREAINATQPHYAGEQALANIEDIANRINGQVKYGVEYSINLLATYAFKLGLKKQPLLANLAIWSDAVLVLLEYIYRTPSFQIFPKLSESFNEIAIIGNNIRSFLLELKCSSNVFAKLFALYRRAFKDLQQALYNFTLFNITPESTLRQFDLLTKIRAWLNLKAKSKIDFYNFQINNAIRLANTLHEKHLSMTFGRLSGINKIVDVGRNDRLRNGGFLTNLIAGVARTVSAATTLPDSVVSFADGRRDAIQNCYDFLQSLERSFRNKLAKWEQGATENDTKAVKLSANERLKLYLTKIISSTDMENLIAKLKTELEIDSRITLCLNNLNVCFTFLISYVYLAFPYDYMYDVALRKHLDGLWNKQDFNYYLNKISEEGSSNQDYIWMRMLNMPEVINSCEYYILNKVKKAKQLRAKNCLTSENVMLEKTLHNLNIFTQLMFHKKLTLESDPGLFLEREKYIQTKQSTHQNIRIQKPTSSNSKKRKMEHYETYGFFKGHKYTYYTAKLPNGNVIKFEPHSTGVTNNNCGYFALPIPNDREGAKEALIKHSENSNIRNLVAPEIEEIVISPNPPAFVQNNAFYKQWRAEYHKLQEQGTSQSIIDKHLGNLRRYIHTPKAYREFILNDVAGSGRLSFYTDKQHTSVLDAIAEIKKLRIYIWRLNEKNGTAELLTVRGPKQGLTVHMHHFPGADTHFELLSEVTIDNLDNPELFKFISQIRIKPTCFNTPDGYQGVYKVMCLDNRLNIRLNSPDWSMNYIDRKIFLSGCKQLIITAFPAIKEHAFELFPRDGLLTAIGPQKIIAKIAPYMRDQHKRIVQELQRFQEPDVKTMQLTEL